MTNIFVVISVADSENKTEVCITMTPGEAGASQDGESGAAIGFVSDWISTVHFLKSESAAHPATTNP